MCASLRLLNVAVKLAEAPPRASARTCIRSACGVSVALLGDRLVAQVLHGMRPGTGEDRVDAPSRSCCKVGMSRYASNRPLELERSLQVRRLDVGMLTVKPLILSVPAWGTTELVEEALLLITDDMRVVYVLSIDLPSSHGTLVSSETAY
ncbi:hypothetical protein BV20DRAFT_728909 [Pilatotrama ljubarskyi]|nr:hypothetical protein BV20DRAFT_728909 [Pilatotrama ljubarskyi]